MRKDFARCIIANVIARNTAAHRNAHADSAQTC